MVYVVFSLSYYGFFEISNKKVDLQFALCNKVNSNQALFLPLMIKLSNEKSQIKSGSRKELSKFLASKHKYPRPSLQMKQKTRPKGLQIILPTNVINASLCLFVFVSAQSDKCRSGAK